MENHPRRTAHPRRFGLVLDQHGREGRVRTQLTADRNHQAYLWLTDRGKSRVIKF